MMKKLVFILFITLLSSQISFAQKKLAFERTGTIYLYSFTDKSEKKLFDGYQQSISPDGNAIAFTETDSLGNRFIATYNIFPDGLEPLTDPIIRFTAVPGQNSYEPKYSPDGKYLVFSYWNGNDWDAAIVAVDNSGFVNLTEPIRVSKGVTAGFYSPTWSPDSKSIVVQDMRSVYEFDLKGNLLKKYDLSALLNSAKVYLSSASTFTYDKTKKYLIFDAENEMYFENLEEPINGIYIYDIEDNEVEIISPSDYSSLDPVISYAENKIYFSAFGKKDIRKVENGDLDYYELNYSIYKMDIDGDNFEKILNNALSPSINK